jgi:hypothetical protein
MRAMGKINTTTILLIGAAAVAAYMLTRPKVVPPLFLPTPLPSAGGSGNSMAQYVQFGTALSNLANSIFGGSSSSSTATITPGQATNIAQQAAGSGFFSI